MTRRDFFVLNMVHVPATAIKSHLVSVNEPHQNSELMMTAIPHHNDFKEPDYGNSVLGATPSLHSPIACAHCG